MRPCFPERAGWFHEFFEESRGWLALPAWPRDWASHEQSTRVLRPVPFIVTGLLQTEDYARHVSATTPVVADDEVSVRVAARMARQQRVLMREDEPPASWFLLDDFGLIRRVGTPEVMAAQMRHLCLRCCRGLPHVTIQVIPGTAHAGLLGGFTVTDRAAYAESVMRGQVFEDEQTVTTCCCRSIRFAVARAARRTAFTS